MCSLSESSLTKLNVRSLQAHSILWLHILHVTLILYRCIGLIDEICAYICSHLTAWSHDDKKCRQIFFLEKKKKKIGTRKPEPKITQQQISCSCSVFPLRLCNVYSPFNVCTFIIQRRCSDLCSTHDARPTQCTQLKSTAQESATYRWRALNGLILQ